jgi:uncharacterized protein YcaQ
MIASLARLRHHAIAHTLFTPTTLKAAIRRLGFVQADPIRSPARAQDLILRHRVKGYRAGDLERRYPALGLDEDYLYAYGFLPTPVSRLLHPRRPRTPHELEPRVLDVVSSAGPIHPRELEEHFGRERVVNGWGGFSKATKHALENLHHSGALRVARRDNGIRVYEASTENGDPLPAADRVRGLALVIANVLAPVPERTLHEAMRSVRRWAPATVSTRAIVAGLLRSGELVREEIDGVAYIRPAGRVAADEAPRTVRFLAPFDPLVWDRRRFEHLWNWPYRFEAYTPPSKRVRGYYAMPMLWGDAVIGWANAGTAGGTLDVEVGFVERRPRDRAFRLELDAEIARLEEFLALERGRA